MWVLWHIALQNAWGNNLGSCYFCSFFRKKSKQKKITTVTKFNILCRWFSNDIPTRTIVHEVVISNACITFHLCKFSVPESEMLMAPVRLRQSQQVLYKFPWIWLYQWSPVLINCHRPKLFLCKDCTFYRYALLVMMYNIQLLPGLKFKIHCHLRLKPGFEPQNWFWAGSVVQSVSLHWVNH